MITTPHYLSIQTTYDHVEVGLFSAHTFLDSIKLDKTYASKNLIIDLNTLLRNNTLKLEDIDFFAVNQGPGPFTSLRVIITTANGLSFATKKPLIGVNGIEQFLAEFHDAQWPHTVALLNAYQNDVYYAIEKNGICTQTGAKNIDLILDELASDNNPVRLIGNSIDIHKKIILNKLGNLAYLQESMPQHVSLQQIGKDAFARWQKKENLSGQLLPLYLKTQEYQKTTV